jgi:hypothetical protein
MGTKLLIATLFIALSTVFTLCLLTLPRLLLRNHPKLSENDFLTRHPQFAWLRWYFMFAIILLISLSIATVLYLKNYPSEDVLVMFGAFPIMFVLPDGLLTASTGICRVRLYPLLGRPAIYLYMYNKQLRFIGITQVITCLFLIIAAAFFALR